MDQRRRTAFDELVSTRSPSLLRMAFLMTGDWPLAEDLVQTALAKAFLRWGSLREVEAGERYVRRLIGSTYCKWWRRRWRRELPTYRLPETRVPDHADEAVLRETVARALAALPARQRVVLVLRFFEDLSETEVATVLGCAPGTVKSRTSRALATLRDMHLLQEAHDHTFRAVVARGARVSRALPIEETS